MTLLPARQRAARLNDAHPSHSKTSVYIYDESEKRNINAREEHNSEVEYGYDVKSLFAYEPQHQRLTKSSHQDNTQNGIVAKLDTLSDNSGSNRDQKWRHFKADTRAGKLLRQIYDVDCNKPKINYPILKIKMPMDKGEEKEKPKWFTGCAKSTQKDPRVKTERRSRELSLAVPKPIPKTRKHCEIPVYNSIRFRKSKAEIDLELKQIEEERASYKPQVTKTISTETEKRKLVAHFQFKGGKALPGGGTLKAIEGNIPLSMITGKPDLALAKRNRIKHGRNLKETNETRERYQREKKILEKRFEDVEAEVKKYREKCEELARNPAATRTLVKIQDELRKCVSELQYLDQQIDLCDKNMIKNEE